MFTWETRFELNAEFKNACTDDMADVDGENWDGIGDGGVETEKIAVFWLCFEAHACHQPARSRA